MKYGLVAALFLVPTLAWAAEFATQSIYLSKDHVTEGQTVLIHAVVSNEIDLAFTGTLTFADASSTIGSVPVSLAAGESSVASVSWKPLAGSHAISATLKDNKGNTVENQSQTFLVDPDPNKPVPEATSTPALIEPSTSIQEGIGSLSPQAESYAQPVFNAIDSARSSAATVLDQQLAATKAKVGPGPSVLGAQTQKSGALDSTWHILTTLYFYLLTLLRFVVGSAGVFYPLLAIAFLWALWRTFRHFRRPAY